VLNAYHDRESHVVRALQRMAELARLMAEAIASESIDRLGELVAEHWTHQRSLHPRITTPRIERTLAAAHDAGAIGGKALGASGGGCVVVIAREGRETQVREAVSRVATLIPFSIDRDGVHLEQTAEKASA
jgi:D-glycero-alpha-D-manno-heptose-7-phosphate kinase